MTSPTRCPAGLPDPRDRRFPEPLQVLQDRIHRHGDGRAHGLGQAHLELAGVVGNHAHQIHLGGVLPRELQTQQGFLHAGIVGAHARTRRMFQDLVLVVQAQLSRVALALDHVHQDQHVVAGQVRVQVQAGSAQVLQDHPVREVVPRQEVRDDVGAEGVVPHEDVAESENSDLQDGLLLVKTGGASSRPPS